MPTTMPTAAPTLMPVGDDGPGDVTTVTPGAQPTSFGRNGEDAPNAGASDSDTPGPVIGGAVAGAMAVAGAVLLLIVLAVAVLALRKRRQNTKAAGSGEHRPVEVFANPAYVDPVAGRTAGALAAVHPVARPALARKDSFC